jgi:multicomponent Na+:H+ antiporter subunit A
MVFGPGLMGGLCLLFGLIPWWVSDYLIEPAVRAFSVVEKEVQLAIFHGFNTPLLLSIVTLTLGGNGLFCPQESPCRPLQRPWAPSP